MRRWFLALWIVACLAGLVVACYGRALFQGEQFAYRDASQYYYPLYQRVQAEWDQGRWPLWEPEENSGMPLLGNPTAAVLYPGKVVFAILPYPLAMRLYVVGHTLLAFVAMLALARHWGTSWAGSAIGALAYAFGGPVLFQHCNVIFLVGAAWLPLGFLAADRWSRLGRRRALAGLAVVLAMETLGGDPQAAYLTGVCAAGYAAAIAWYRGRSDRSLAGVAARRLAPATLVFGIVLILVLWFVAVLAVACAAPAFWRSAGAESQRPSSSIPWAGWAVAAAWGLAGTWLVVRWRRVSAESRPILAPMLLGLVTAALVAAATSAAQLLPVLEFISQSGRASGEALHDYYPFSFHPVRLVEFVWPNVFGSSFQGNTNWLKALPVKGSDAAVWVPTIYLGGLTLVLAMAGLLRPSGAERASAPWRAWMASIAVLSVLAAFGEFGSPVWVARMVPQAERWLGSGPQADTGTPGVLRDGDGGVYWLLATALPGFGRFRYPSKLLTFTALGVSLLAAQGWDAVARCDPRARRRLAAWPACLFVLSLVALGASAALGDRFIGWLAGKTFTTVYGPIKPAAALAETQRGLLQAAVVLAVSLALVFRLIGRRPLAAAALGLVVTAADLALGNARFVMTVPQSVIDAPPEALAIIDQAERGRPRPGPYRVHRMPGWSPSAWVTAGSPHRVRDFVEWERDTLAAKRGITLGVHYTATLSVTELYDYRWFISGFYFRARDRAARVLSVQPGTPILVHSRRAFNMWNTRYFILPYGPMWDDPFRGIASFLERTERVFPARDAFQGPEGRAREEAWVHSHDYQVRRNLDEFPRAWIVHDARALPPFRSLSRAGRDRPMEEMLFSNDMTWPDPARIVHDPRLYAWLDQSDRPALAAYLPGGYPSSGEIVTVSRLRSDRVELEAVLERPGLVVLADIHYPGWSLTIDDRPAPVFRANHVMRGAAVPAGRHILVYTFRPMSFRAGLVVSGVGLLALGLLALWPERALAPPQGDPGAGS